MDGVRDEKTVNGEKHAYVTQGGNVVYETWGDNKLEFVYGSSGEPYAVIYNGTTYYYVTNLQGDVVRLVDAGGQTVASYTYTSWGEVLKVQSNSTDNIANINPIRYRGYYYDTETGWYYLQNRYYDPVCKRMLSPDTEEAITDDVSTIKQKNLYAYCDNNPVIYADDDGNYVHIVVAAAIGAGISLTTTVLSNVVDRKPWSAGVVTSVLAGAAGGALGATGIRRSFPRECWSLYAAEYDRPTNSQQLGCP